MIEPMKRLDVIFPATERITFLQDLQELGMVQPDRITPLPADSLLVQSLGRTMEVLEWLKGMCAAWKVSIPQAPCTTGVDVLVERLDTARRRLREQEDRLRELRLRREAQAPWGQFDPETLAALDRAGVTVAFCSCRITDFRPAGGQSVWVTELSRKESEVHFVAIHHRKDPLDDADKSLLAMQADIPKEDLELLDHEIRDLEDQADQTLREILDAGRYLTSVEYHLRRMDDMSRQEETGRGLEMTADGCICVMGAWFPARQEAALREWFATREEPWFLRDPLPDEKVPVLLRQGWFTRLFAPIMRIYGLPDYHESDTTPFIAPFYALFYGLCVADAGYGILVLAVLGIVMVRRGKGPLQSIAGLAAVLALSVVAGGFLLDDYFGVRLVKEGSPAGIWGLFSSRNDAMLLPVVLGFLQITTGYLVRLVNHARAHGWQGIMLPVGVLLILWSGGIQGLLMAGPAFHVGPLALGLIHPCLSPLAVPVMAGTGLFLVLFFNGLESHTPWFLRPLKGLWNLYELATGLPGDILSYLRLFALGLAGGLLAEAVNHIGLMVLGTNPGPHNFIFMGMVLLVGHGLNFGLGLLSAFVHSLRLTFVEFYKAVEFTGGGREWRVFGLEARNAPEYRMHKNRTVPG